MWLPWDFLHTRLYHPWLEIVLFLVQSGYLYSDVRTWLSCEKYEVMCFGVSNEIILFCSFLKRTKNGNCENCPLIIKLVIQSVSFLATPIFFGEMLLKPFTYFRLFVLLDICSCTYFLWLVFAFLMVSVEAQKFLIVIKFNISYFLSKLMIFVIKNSWANQRSQRIFSVVLSSPTIIPWSILD